MINSDARHGWQSKLPRRLEATFAIEHGVVLADQEGNIEAERANGTCDLPHMSNVGFAKAPNRRAQALRRICLDLKRR